MTNPIMPNADKARNALLSIVTAARSGQMDLASTLTREYQMLNGGEIMPLFISAVSLIETILLSVADEIGMDADKLFSGICLGLSIKQIEEQQNQQSEEE